MASATPMPIPAFAPVVREVGEEAVEREEAVCCGWDDAVEPVVEVVMEVAAVYEDDDACIVDVGVFTTDDIDEEDTDVEVDVSVFPPAASVAVLTITTPDESSFKSAGAGA